MLIFACTCLGTLALKLALDLEVDLVDSKSQVSVLVQFWKFDRADFLENWLE